MPYTGHHKGYIIFLAILYGILIPYRATWLYHGCDTRLVPHTRAVVEWEECV